MPKEHAGRRYDLFFEDPHTFVEQLKIAGESNILFQWSTVRKYKINPWRFMRNHFPGIKWRLYIVNENHSYEQDYTCKEQEVKGVYPTWSYKKYDLKELRNYIEYPWSSSYNLSSDLQWFERPVVDQPHRVFILDAFPGKSLEDRNRIRKLAKIQRAYPEVELFLVPKSYSFGMMFGMGFTASCFGPYHHVRNYNGSLLTPGGKVIPWRDIPLFEDVFEKFGYSTDWIMESRDNGVQYMIDSARWAAHHWDAPTGKFPIANRFKVDYQNPDMYAKVLSYERVPTFNAEKLKPTDKVLCNSCALWRKCPSYRSGEVCNLPSSRTRKLTELAGSRNAGDVIEMLSTVVEIQAERAERLIEREELENKPIDGVDKAINNLFKNGKQLALLLNPNLGRPLVGVQINNNLPHAHSTQAVSSADTRGLVASMFKELEASGIPRESITEQMVLDHIKAKYEQRAIEAEVVPNEQVGD